MTIKSKTVKLEKTKDQSLSKQTAQENLSEIQKLPSIAPPITYEMLEESETKEAAVFRDMRENMELWETLTNREVLQRIAAIHKRVEEELRAQEQA